MTGELGCKLEQGGYSSPLAQRGRLMLCRYWVLLTSYVLELHPGLMSAHPFPASLQPWSSSSPALPGAFQQHPWAVPTACSP